jgi:D-arabinose 1-dehydrogenase-like Zn-dependent alcohol dehydrogenase
MRAQILETFNAPYKYTTSHPVPPQPEKHDLLIRVLAASYCHTDAVFASGQMQPDLPRVGSHEFAGEVIALGSAVSPNLGLTVGTRVGVPGRSYRPCGKCGECKYEDGDAEGYSVYCSKALNLGLTADGGFQDYVCVDSRQVVSVPEGMEPKEVAPLMCAGVTIWAAIERAGDGIAQGNGRWLAISGAGGGLGHLGVQFAIKLGWNVVAVDAADKPLELLAKVVQDQGSSNGETMIIDARTEDAHVVKCQIGCEELDEEKGADAVLILPEGQKALDYATSLLKNHGTCVVVSFPEKGFHISARDLVFRDIKLVGSLVGRNHQLKAMLNFAAEHGVRAVSSYFSLDKLNDLVDSYHKGHGGKLVVDMSL